MSSSREKLIGLAESLEIEDPYGFANLPIEEIKEYGEQITKRTKLAIETAEWFMESKGFV